MVLKAEVQLQQQQQQRQAHDMQKIHDLLTHEEMKNSNERFECGRVLAELEELIGPVKWRRR